MRLFSAPLIALALLSPSLSECGDKTDADGDGYPAETDCDDTNPSTHPGAAETCDAVDNDCDGALDEGCARLEIVSRYSGIQVTGGNQDGQNDDGQAFDELEETYDFEPFDAAVDGTLLLGEGWSIEASAWQVSTLSTTSISAAGEAHIQLQDSRGGGGGSAVANNLFDVDFKLDAPANGTFDITLATDIYERMDELSVFIEVTGPDGEMFTEALVEEEDAVTFTHEALLPAGLYRVQVEAFTTTSLSGWWDDYPGSTATWGLELTLE